MKIRIRLRARTERVEVNGDITLGDFKAKVARTFSLEPGNVDLSLNGRDVLEGTDDTPLAQFEVVSGDLIRILTQDNSSAKQEESSRCSARNSKGESSLQQRGILSNSISAVSPQSSHQNNMDTSDKPSTSRQSDEQEMDLETQSPQDNENRAMAEAIAPKISEPMLCREASDKAIPLRLRQLLNEWQPSNQCEALCIALHVLMLETGFLAKLPQQSAESKPQQQSTSKHKVTDSSIDTEDVAPDNTSAMPPDWKASSAAYKITYLHPMCEGAECSVAWVPLGSVVMVHALTSGQAHFQLKLCAGEFVNKSTGKMRDDCVPYKQLALLSRQFKDDVAHPLLEAVRSELGLVPLHGLMALVPEIQLLILNFLDANSLLRMSEVCTHFHSIATDMSLWRQLVLKDFGGRTTDSNSNWRELYKQKYLARKEMQQARSRMTYVFPPLVPPHQGMVPPLPDPMHPMYPPGYRGGDYDLDPFSGGVPMFPGGRHGRIPNAGPFPGARHDPIFPESDFRPGRGGGLRDMGRSGRSSGNRRLFPGGGGFGF